MSDSTISIRTLQKEDFDAILRINAEEFRSASIDALIEERFGGAHWSEIKAVTIKKELETYPDSCFVAVMDGKVVGYVTNLINETASRGTIANLAVSSICQGKGIGRKLLDRSIEHFREIGLHHAKIETLATNEAGRHLYPKLGFEEIVQQVHFAMKL